MAEIEHIFGAFPIESTCSHADCLEDATSVYPVLTRDRGLELYWLCPEHADEIHKDRVDLANDLPAAEVNKTHVYTILRTCGKGKGQAPCGAVATHVVVVGLRDPDPRLGTVSVCEKHLHETNQEEQP